MGIIHSKGVYIKVLGKKEDIMPQGNKKRWGGDYR